MSSGHVPEPKNFEPKKPVHLDAPKDDSISVQQLSKCDGRLPLLVNGILFSVELALYKGCLAWCCLSSVLFIGNGVAKQWTGLLRPSTTGSEPNLPTYVAIKGRVFDVSGNAAYAPKGQYHGMKTPFLPPFQLAKREVPPKQHAHFRSGRERDRHGC